jgi:exopolyphosphatase/guanosine-5'-triphosphate,3'-diphosphate pyrophosphatase
VTGVDEVVPRWEWRTSDEVGPAAARLASETPHQVHDSDEMYMVTGPGEDTVKVRDGLVDVKQLEEVDDHGLERWRPVLKRPSTLTADDVHVLARALHATALRVVAVH